MTYYPQMKSINPCNHCRISKQCRDNFDDDEKPPCYFRSRPKFTRPELDVLLEKIYVAVKKECGNDTMEESVFLPILERVFDGIRKHREQYP